MTHNVTASSYFWRGLCRQLIASMTIPTDAAALTELVELVPDMLAGCGTRVPDLRSFSADHRFSPSNAEWTVGSIREILDASNACVKKYPDNSPVTGVWHGFTTQGMIRSE